MCAGVPDIDYAVRAGEPPSNTGARLGQMFVFR